MIEFQLWRKLILMLPRADIILGGRASIAVGQRVGSLFADVIIRVLVLIVVIGLFVLVAAVIRRMAVGMGEQPSEGMTIEQLDGLLSRGAITEQEYRLARRSLLKLRQQSAPAEQPDQEDASGPAEG